LQKQGANCHFCEKVEDLALLSDRMLGDGRGSWGLALLAFGDSTYGDSTYGDSAYGDSAYGDDALEGSPAAASQRAFGLGSWASAIRDQCSEATQIWVATRGLQAVRSKDRRALETARLVPGEIAGFARCVEMQQCRLFDVGEEFDHPERVMLASLMGRVAEERQFAARGEHLYVPRLIELDSSQTGEGALAKRSDVVAGERNFRAIHSGEEGLECLALEQRVEPQLGAGEVVVEVCSAALSQLDVLTGLGLARGSGSKSRGVALDFAGVVRAVPDSACDFEVGEEVIGIREGALARRLVVPAAFLAPKPGSLDFDQAASLPFPFLVARYALQVVARLRAGERILILSAAGGVGQALIGIAQSIGAEVSATASTASRRATLRDLGVRVIDASSATSIPADEEFEGAGDFDVIASADSGPAMHAMLARLAPGGRYLDLCPRNEFERPELGALRLAPNRSVSAIDVAAMMRTDPTLVSALLEETADDVNRGRLLPPATTVFPVSQAGRALRYMAQNRHLGRVCVNLAAAGQSRIRALERPGVALTGWGAFVVSGDESEIRSAVTEWLRGQGADHVVELAADATHDVDSALSPPRLRLAGWIHVASEAVPASDRVEGLLPLLTAKPADFRAIISVREPVAGDSGLDRAWETRGWVDRLLLSGEADWGRSFVLSVAEDSSPRRVAREL
ncbi:MAG: zinc-binding dehydrogenase, partial [Myxococcota bacterium]